MADYVSEARAQANMTASQLDDLLGFEQGFIKKIEAGEVDLKAYPPEACLGHRRLHSDAARNDPGCSGAGSRSNERELRVEIGLKVLVGLAGVRSLDGEVVRYKRLERLSSRRRLDTFIRMHAQISF
ncbi:MAG: hypothetical protein KKC85_22010 [Gammaproteobacteria bacterium]|nr:hypothetical protein [Gammaproteobacteria bacterium]